ncbi:hypothetical protein Lal_00021059 [Lupinus albus]|nr:hypothetical protein Lal_00021059 [Lupinus albus]
MRGAAPSLNVPSCGREVPGESMLSAETGLEAFEKPNANSRRQSDTAHLAAPPEMPSGAQNAISRPGETTLAQARIS